MSEIRRPKSYGKEVADSLIGPEISIFINCGLTSVPSIADLDQWER